VTQRQQLAAVSWRCFKVADRQDPAGATGGVAYKLWSTSTSCDEMFLALYV